MNWSNVVSIAFIAPPSDAQRSCRGVTRAQ